MQEQEWQSYVDQAFNRMDLDGDGYIGGCGGGVCVVGVCGVLWVFGGGCGVAVQRVLVVVVVGVCELGIQREWSRRQPVPVFASCV